MSPSSHQKEKEKKKKKLGKKRKKFQLLNVEEKIENHYFEGFLLPLPPEIIAMKD